MQRTLKFIVAFLGVAILAVMAVIAFALVGRFSDDGALGPEDDHGPAGFDRVALGLPAGTTVTGTEAADGRLVLRVRLPGGAERVVILDMDSGAVLGTIDVTDGNVTDGR